MQYVSYSGCGFIDNITVQHFLHSCPAPCKLVNVNNTICVYDTNVYDLAVFGYSLIVIFWHLMPSKKPVSNHLLILTIVSVNIIASKTSWHRNT